MNATILKTVEQAREAFEQADSQQRLTERRLKAGDAATDKRNDDAIVMRVDALDALIAAAKREAYEEAAQAVRPQGWLLVRLDDGRIVDGGEHAAARIRSLGSPA